MIGDDWLLFTAVALFAIASQAAVFAGGMAAQRILDRRQGKG